MSGAEAITVSGLISSVITIIETFRDLYDAATRAEGLPEAFRAVLQKVPLVLNILQDCRDVQERADLEYANSNKAGHKRELEESNRAVKSIMTSCEENALRLKDIFEQVVPRDSVGPVERYKKAAQAVMPGKKRKVEELMKDILENLQLLQSNRFFQVEMENRSKDLNAAIKHLSELPDEDTRYSQSGSGSMNINAGTGTQQNYNQSGGTNNRQYNAQTQHFGKD